MSPELSDTLVLYFQMKMLMPLILLSVIPIVFLVALLADGLHKFRWWLQKKRLIVRARDYTISDPVAKHWGGNKGWVFYKELHELTWWERNVLLDKKF